MALPQHLAKHLRDVHTGGNWTSVNLKEVLADLTWQQATTHVYSLNTIATLVYHINYYISAVIEVLKGGPLVASDKLSFDVPPINSDLEWQALLQKAFAEADLFASLIELLPEQRLWENFTDEKYGNYYRNIQGIIEHTHYHLGQIVVIKKVLSTRETIPGQ